MITHAPSTSYKEIKMRRRQMYKKALVRVVIATLALLLALIGAAAPASAATYTHNIGAGDIIGQPISCDGKVDIITYFGNDVSHGTSKGIVVGHVEIRNLTGYQIFIQGQFHNMGGYGGQGHRDLSRRPLGKGVTLTWNINTPFWFTFSSSWWISSPECGSNKQDNVLWRGPTH